MFKLYVDEVKYHNIKPEWRFVAQFKTLIAAQVRMAKEVERHPDFVFKIEEHK